jgi:hypothetical protein
VGIKIKVQIQKNKVGLAFRVIEMPFMFGYGIDDVAASLDWLHEVHRPAAWTGEAVAKMTDDEHHDMQIVLAGQVQEAWAEVETSFLPKRSKYG